MNPRLACIFAFMLVLLFIASFPAHAQSANPQQTLHQYIADLRKNPDDYALREKIIKHVQAMKPAPAVPEEARRFMNRGMAAAEGAKTESDYRDAIQEFQKAVNSAPWLGSGYRNLAVVQDKAGQFAQAVQNLTLFLLTNPSAADAEAAKTLIDKIEYRQEKAAKESSPQAVAAKKQKEYEDWLKKINGRRYTHGGDIPGTASVLDVKGKVLITGVWAETWSPIQGPRGYTEHHRYEINGRTAVSPVMNAPAPIGSLQVFYTISDDGDRIIQQTRTGNGQTSERIFLWQR